MYIFVYSFIYCLSLFICTYIISTFHFIDVFYILCDVRRRMDDLLFSFIFCKKILEFLLKYH